MQDRSGRKRAAGGRRGALCLAWILVSALARAQEPAGPGGEAKQEPNPKPPETPPAQSAPAETTPLAPNETKPAPPVAVRDPAHTYLFLEDQAALLAQWSASQRVERLELGTSFGGRELFAVQFGAPGPRPLA